MSFPAVQATATSVSSTSITTHTISTPAGVVSGDLLIAMIAIEDDGSGITFGSWSDGFIEIKDVVNGECAFACAYKFADGTEGADITVVSSAAERAAHCMYRIDNMHPTLAPEISTVATATNVNPDPDSLTPAGGAKDYLWLAFCAFERDDEIITAFPTNYGSNQVNISMFSGGTVGCGTRDLNAASEDPGTYTISGVEEWFAGTIAVHPAPTAAVTGTAVPTSTESQIVAGGRTIILTLTGDTWVAAGAAFDAVRQDIIDGLDSAGAELLGWNNEVRDKEVVGAVVRTSDTVVTITLSASPLYDITVNETITVTIPGSAVVSGGPITATPTFDILFEVVEDRGHWRDRHPSGHSESGLDVNEADVNTTDVNTYDVN